MDIMAAIWADDIFKCILLNEKAFYKISLKFVPKSQIWNLWDYIFEIIAIVASQQCVNE